jgi:hypothetical protein
MTMQIISHQPRLEYIVHKHIKDKIILSEIPDIEQVILEIITDYLS